MRRYVRVSRNEHGRVCFERGRGGVWFIKEQVWVEGNHSKKLSKAFDACVFLACPAELQSIPSTICECMHSQQIWYHPKLLETEPLKQLLQHTDSKDPGVAQQTSQPHTHRVSKKHSSSSITATTTTSAAQQQHRRSTATTSNSSGTDCRLSLSVVTHLTVSQARLKCTAQGTAHTETTHCQEPYRVSQLTQGTLDFAPHLPAPICFIRMASCLQLKSSACVPNLTRVGGGSLHLPNITSWLGYSWTSTAHSTAVSWAPACSKVSETAALVARLDVWFTA